jgi:hypothetical protein
MKITTLSALFLAASVSLVSAAPRDNESTERISYTGKKRPPPPPKADAWVELASPTPCSHGREYIDVEPSSGLFVRLRIGAFVGRPIIRTVRVDYTDGKQAVVRVDSVVDRARPAYVQVRSAQIERVVVVSEGNSKTSYTVAAEPARTVASR